MEIERKYLMAVMPEKLEKYRYIDMEQGYISTAPVIRIRKKKTTDSERYVLTVKSSGMLARQEYELELDREEYETLRLKVDGNIISKRRYMLPLDGQGLILELDIFEGDLKGLVMGEVEFPDEKMADSFVPPDFFGREVTFDRRFHNSSMSKMQDAEIEALIAELTDLNKVQEV